MKNAFQNTVKFFTTNPLEKLVALFFGTNQALKAGMYFYDNRLFEVFDGFPVWTMHLINIVLIPLSISFCYTGVLAFTEALEKIGNKVLAKTAN
jgi:hypothetical protein